jgi:prepilin-type processing-associated H-X9-DG protein
VQTNTKSEQPFLTWDARLLPWLEQEPLWRNVQNAFQTDRWFPAPAHDGNRAVVLTVFLCPATDRTLDWAKPEEFAVAFSHYLGVSGVRHDEGVLFADSRVRLGDVADGVSNTLMVGERPPSADGRFGWWYAGVGQEMDGSSDSYSAVRQVNVTFRAPSCPTGPYHFQAGSETDSCSMFHFWSQHSGGAHFLFCDGSVHFLSYAADQVMPALASRTGGEVVEVP